MKNWKLWIVVAAFGMVAIAVRGADAAPSADDLIAAAKAATGGPAWDKVVTWHEVDKATAGGLTGSAESWIDLPTLHNTGTYELGPLAGGSGWDGVHVWTTDSSKEVRIESSEESVDDAMQDAYRLAWALFFPDRYAATREYTGVRKADGKSFDAVKMTPKGADPLEVWFDQATHRVDREVQLTGSQPRTFLFSKYAPVDGVTVPFKVIERVANDPKFDIVGEATSIVFGGPEPLSRYAPPPPPADLAQWPAGKDSVTVPFQLMNNHIYLDVSINGEAPRPFVFDTGATNVLDKGAAKALGVAQKGSLPGGGFGDKVDPFGVAKVASVSIGGLALKDQTFITSDTAGWMKVEGTPSAGLVGYEFVKRAVLAIDYAKRTMTFTKPSAFQPPAGVTAVPFTFSDHTPMVAATVDGLTGQFALDTGSRGGLEVMAPFAKANNLVDKYHATITGTVGYGVGGPARALLGRASDLTIGPVSVKSPVVEIATDKAGAGMVTHTAGNIGGDIWKRFTVTLDYGHQLVWFEPNALASQPEVYDRSGLWISRGADGAIQVADVTTKSAAAKAGLHVGDEIVSINGKPAKDVAIHDLRDEFKGANGTKFDLIVKRGSAEKPIPLVLSDIV